MVALQSLLKLGRKSFGQEEVTSSFSDSHDLVIWNLYYAKFHFLKRYIAELLHA